MEEYLDLNTDPLHAAENLLKMARERDPHQPEFLQAVEEVVTSLEPLFKEEPRYIDVMHRLIEPERVISFRVAWADSKDKVHVNRGYRIGFNSAIGPFKGGLRFHPSVNLSIMKFLAFEQTFKNSLTTLMMGGGKGGSDFDPKGKSDMDIMRFCQAFMIELSRHIGADVDIPAGDVGVGALEIGYLFGQYKRISNEFTGVLTGRGTASGGSLIRPEATGYGLVYFVSEILSHKWETQLEGKRVLLSGGGKVAQYAVERLISFGAIPLTLSDSGGYIYEPEGFTTEKLAAVMDIKNVQRGSLADYAKRYPGCQYVEGKRPWKVAKADIALPCATQNEIEEADAKDLVEQGVYLVCEGANMPSTLEAVQVFFKNQVVFGPSKAANAGGVAVSGLEMAQHSQRLAWTREVVDQKLWDIMKDIYQTCTFYGKKYAGDPNNLMVGANIGGFLKVATAMIEQGIV